MISTKLRTNFRSALVHLLISQLPARRVGIQARTFVFCSLSLKLKSIFDFAIIGFGPWFAQLFKVYCQVYFYNSSNSLNLVSIQQFFHVLLMPPWIFFNPTIWLIVNYFFEDLSISVNALDLTHPFWCTLLDVLYVKSLFDWLIVSYPMQFDVKTWQLQTKFHQWQQFQTSLSAFILW